VIVPDRSIPGVKQSNKLKRFEKPGLMQVSFHSRHIHLASRRSPHVHYTFTTRSLHVHCSLHCCTEGAWPSNMNPSYSEHNNIRRAYEYAVFAVYTYK